MRQAVLLGNPNTKRTLYLERAAAHIGLPILLVDWKDWRVGLPREKLFLKIDPPVWESCSLDELDKLTGDYIGCLEELSQMAKEGSVEFLNQPKAIAALLDKRACKDRLIEAGIPVTEPLVGCDKPGAVEAKIPVTEPLTGCYRPDVLEALPCAGDFAVEVLLALMKEKHIHQVFIKPVRGSGAAGVSAFRWQPSSGRMVLYTCALQSTEHGLVNTKRLRRFSEAAEIFPLLGQILKLNCIVERWYAKAECQGFSYDLRAVVQDGELDFILARLSKGPITNLHLNNHPLDAAKLGLPMSVWDGILQLCQKSMECYPGLRSAGIDILLERGSLKPRVIEMNAQGDLIYQDIYNENLIYRHQVEMMKECC